MDIRLLNAIDEVLQLRKVQGRGTIVKSIRGLLAYAELELDRLESSNDKRDPRRAILHEVEVVDPLRRIAALAEAAAAEGAAEAQRAAHADTIACLSILALHCRSTNSVQPLFDLVEAMVGQEVRA
jgi:hypothetical protein